MLFRNDNDEGGGLREIETDERSRSWAGGLNGESEERRRDLVLMVDCALRIEFKSRVTIIGLKDI